MAKLKVYRTPIGFHDAYVAAPSQKAALAAWGSDRDLFARGVAEVVTDPALAAEPLARPGEVIKRSRGTAAEQIAALPPSPPRAARTDAVDPDDTPGSRADPVRAAPPRQPDRATPPRQQDRATPPRKPDRAALGAAEDALAQAEARHRSDERTLRAEEAALAKRRRAMERDQADERAALEAERDTAAAAYNRAMRLWRGGSRGT